MERIVAQVVVLPTFGRIVRNPVVIGSGKPFAENHHLGDGIIILTLGDVEGVQDLLGILTLDAE